MKLKMMKASLSKHLPTILTVGAIVLTVGAVVTAVARKPKYDSLIDEKKKEATEKGKEVSKVDIAKCAVKAYWPTLLLIAASGACSIGSKKALTKQIVSASATAATYKKLSDDYKDVVNSTLKPKQVEEIKDAVCKKQVNEVIDKVVDPEAIPFQKHYDGPAPGMQLMADAWTGTLFNGDPEDIKRKLNKFNSEYMLRAEGDVLLKWYYMELDIPIDEGTSNCVKDAGWEIGSPIIEIRWVMWPIKSGPLAGKIVWAMQFEDKSEPQYLY